LLRTLRSALQQRKSPVDLPAKRGKRNTRTGDIHPASSEVLRTVVSAGDHRETIGETKNPLIYSELLRADPNTADALS